MTQASAAAHCTASSPVTHPPQSLQLTTATIRAIDLALYAAASGDHNPLHLDEQSAERSGFELPLVHGMLTMAHAARMFTKAFGAGALESLQTRFTGVALRGERLTFQATLESADDALAHYSLQASSDSGSTLVEGRASVRLDRVGAVAS